MTLPREVPKARIDEVLALLGIDERRMTRITIDPDIITVTRHRLSDDGEPVVTRKGISTVSEEIGILFAEKVV